MMSTGISGQSLIIRADASTRIGTGHLMRCLALAQAWQDAGGHAVFVMAMESPVQEARLQSEGMEVVHLATEQGSVEDTKQTAAFAQKMEASWVVVDGYHFDVDYQQIIKDSGLSLLFIDDIGHADHYHADVVLNQNIHANERLYVNRESYTRLLLGTPYVLLRREFLKWRGWRRKIPEVARRILVTLGGGDPDNVTLKVIQALQQLKILDLEAKVVVGPNNAHLEGLHCEVERSTCNVQVLTAVIDMPELMAWADVAVSAGGSTCWELAFMGLPNVVLVLAGNQVPIAEGLSAKGIALSLGWYERASDVDIDNGLRNLLFSPERQATMSLKGQALIDGAGCKRVIGAMNRKRLSLRSASEQDCKLLWKLVNELDVRKSAFNSDFIPWEDHVRWFSKKLKDPHWFQFIALNHQDVPIGQVRFEVMGEEADIDVNIDKYKRGLGYGSLLIQTGVEELASHTPIKAVHAFIKQENKVSIKAFQKAGFKNQGVEVVKGHISVHLVCRNNE